MTIRRFATLAAAATAAVLIASSAQAQVGAAARGPNNPSPAPAQDARDIEICFHSAIKFKKSQFCVTSAQRTMSVEDHWKTRIESISVKGGSVRICSEVNLRGTCSVLSASRPELPEALFDHVHSFKID